MCFATHTITLCGPCLLEELFFSLPRGFFLTQLPRGVSDTRVCVCVRASVGCVCVAPAVVNSTLARALASTGSSQRSKKKGKRDGAVATLALLACRMRKPQRVTQSAGMICILQPQHL